MPTNTDYDTTSATDYDSRARLLRRCPHDRMVAGVAAGIAEFADVDVTAVRIAFVVLAFLGGLALPLYLAAWLLIPDEESETSIADELLARAGLR